MIGQSNFKISLVIVVVFTILNVEVNARLGGKRAMIDASSLASVEDVRHAAEDVLKRFHQEELDPDFGDGLPESDVDKIREGSEEFWGLLKGIQNEDVQSLSDEEGVAAQNIIAEVARLDEDLDNPDRKDSVMPEYRHLESELSDVDW